MNRETRVFVLGMMLVITGLGLNFQRPVYDHSLGNILVFGGFMVMLLNVLVLITTKITIKGLNNG